jgi:hypothetical protein
LILATASLRPSDSRLSDNSVALFRRTSQRTGIVKPVTLLNSYLTLTASI